MEAFEEDDPPGPAAARANKDAGRPGRQMQYELLKAALLRRRRPDGRQLTDIAMSRYFWWATVHQIAAVRAQLIERGELDRDDSHDLPRD